MAPGTTICVAYPDGTTPHLHIVLTEPFGNPEVVVLVNLRSCKALPFEDHTTVITPGDHPFVQRQSYIPYDYAKKVRLDVITRKLEEGKAERREDLSEQLLARFVVMSAEDWERDQETLYVLQNTSLMQQIAEASTTHQGGTGYSPTKEQLDEILGV